MGKIKELREEIAEKARECTVAENLVSALRRGEQPLVFTRRFEHTYPVCIRVSVFCPWRAAGAVVLLEQSYGPDRTIEEIFRSTDYYARFGAWTYAGEGRESAEIRGWLRDCAPGIARAEHDAPHPYDQGAPDGAWWE